MFFALIIKKRILLCLMLKIQKKELENYDLKLFLIQQILILQVIQDVQKTTNGLEDKLVVKNENKEAFSDTEAIGIDEKQSNENKNLILNKFKDFSNIKKNQVSKT